MNIAIVFWSGTGNTEAMADAIHKKCKDSGAQSTLFYATEFGLSDIENYDAFAFGCPASGDENLEPDEFQPMWDSVLPALQGKRIALFGSYGWNNGEWMDIWEKEAGEAGVELVYAPVIAEEAPKGDVLEKLAEMALALLK